MGAAKAALWLRSRMNLESQRALWAPAKNSTISRRSIATCTSTIFCSGGLRPRPSLASAGSESLFVEILSLKESVEERRCFIRDADNLVRCLTIEFEIEFSLGSVVVPVGKKFELAASQAPLRERGAFDGDAHARRLPGDPAFLWNRFG